MNGLRVSLLVALLLLASPAVPGATEDAVACTLMYPFSDLCKPDKVAAAKCIVERELGLGDCR